MELLYHVYNDDVIFNFLTAQQQNRVYNLYCQTVYYIYVYLYIYIPFVYRIENINTAILRKSHWPKLAE